MRRPILCFILPILAALLPGSAMADPLVRVVGVGIVGTAGLVAIGASLGYMGAQVDASEAPQRAESEQA